MNNSIKILALLSLLPFVASAQTGFDSDVDAELDQLYSTPVQSGTVASPAAQAKGGIQSNAPISGGQPIYILNQAPTSATQVQSANPSAAAVQTQVQKQPTTYVESTPLNESNADRMRKARQDAELHTETKIVEKLELSRMDDEKRRAQVLFGDKFDKLNNNNQNPDTSATPVAVPVQAVQPVAAPQPVQIQVVPAAAPVSTENTRDIIREELQSALKTEQELPAQPIEQKYFAGLVGVGEYPDVSNVTGNYALGFTFGTKYDDAYAIEGTFIYSNYTLKNVDGNGNPFYPLNQDVNQYAGSIGAKYFLFNGMVKPVLGGLIQYSYRAYSWSDQNVNNGINGQNKDVNSQAIDLGALVGADIEFSKKATLGIDFRYMFNLSNRNNNNNSYTPPGTTALEKLNYYVMSVTGKVSF